MTIAEKWTNWPIDQIAAERVAVRAVRVNSLCEHWIVPLAESEIGMVLDANPDGDYFAIEGWTVIGSLVSESLGSVDFTYTVIELASVPTTEPLVLVKRKAAGG